MSIIDRLMCERNTQGVSTGRYFFDSGVPGDIVPLQLDAIVTPNFRKTALFKANNVLDNFTSVIPSRESFKLLSIMVNVPIWFDIYPNQNITNLVCSLNKQPIEEPEPPPYSVYRFSVPGINQEFGVNQYIKHVPSTPIIDEGVFIDIEEYEDIRFYSSPSTPVGFQNKKIYIDFSLTIESTTGFKYV
ncbi:MAG: hypothetical protein GY793_10290 [Proteobacteria bacterium]|nr:hypothetical protein [Pseudomonadota bacterium]